MTADGALRINKYLSERGLCSRREADAWIAARRVTVNGAVATLGTKVGAADEVRLDGEPLGAPSHHVYIALHKPVGVECTTDQRVPHNIVDFVAHPERVFPIGRLDKDSEGLILLTNDGDIVNLLLRAEHSHEKEYLVTVDRPLTDEFLKAMAAGVEILGTLTAPCRTERVSKNVFRIVLTQGLNRQIRRMCDVFGYTVRRLVRVRFVSVRLEGLEPGRWRNLTRAELAALLPERFGRGRRAAPTETSR
ncbi:MAG TPA: pseudouridine synthase [Steroidobacteraceae bacterium]|nr:pseudouridine synthase [Steroidobacteraceae bacterium]